MGIWAGVIAAILGSSVALGSVFTPAELLAVLPSATSVLLLLLARRAPRQHLLLVLAGLLAAAALLVKQSFGDAIAAGVVFLVAGALLDGGDRRRWVGLAGAYLAGVALAVLGMEAWEVLSGVPDGATTFALLGFRLEGLSALAGSAGGLPGRFADRLALPMVGSGLGLVFLWALVGLRTLSARRDLQLIIGAWGIAGLGGILLGGSYWPHYLIEVVPVAAATAGVALAAGRRTLVRISGGALIGVALASGLVGPSLSGATAANTRAEELGRSIAARSHRGDTIYVRYSQPNVTYYSGLRNPFPYEWSLMLRTIPAAQPELRSMLRSPQRPTWLVGWEPSDAYGLDADGRTAAVVHQRYRPAGRVDDIEILLERGLRRPLDRARHLGP